jgi:hypothetical protein
LQPTTDHDDHNQSNADPDCDNANCNIAYSSIHSDQNADISSLDDDNDRSLYGTALPEIDSDGSFHFASDNDDCDIDYEPGSDHGSQDMDLM